MFDVDDLDDFNVDFDDDAPFNGNDSTVSNKPETQPKNVANKSLSSSQFVLRTKEPKNDVNKDGLNVNNEKNVDKTELRRTPVDSNNKNADAISKPEAINFEGRKSGGSKSDKNLKNKVMQQRKFPGPAGLLPDKPLKDLKNISLILDPEAEELEAKNESVIYYSQTSASVFEEPPYLKLLSDFNMNRADNRLHQYTIDWVKKKLNKMSFGQRIPFLAVVLHHLDHSMPDPVVILKDPTGEIYGTLHREAWNDIGGKLHPGSALALRQVGVLSVSRRQVYLNITMNNILSIYTAFDESDDVEKNSVNEMSSFELLKSIDEWQAQAQAQAQAQSTVETPERNTTNNSLFFSINHQDSPNLLKRKLNQSTPIKKPNVVNKPVEARAETSKLNFDFSMEGINFDEFSKGEKIPENLPKSNPVNKLVESNFDISMDDINFDEFSEEKILEKNPKTDNQSKPEFVKPNEFSFKPKEKPESKPKDKLKPSKKFIPKPKEKESIFSQVLTQEENKAVEETLDGIDLDDFDL